MNPSAPENGARLIVVGGLPGTGKTTLSRLLAQRLGAINLRIDAIEQALRDSGDLANGVTNSGYRVAYALAREHLSLGGSVVADCVNPISLTRETWQQTAHACGTNCLQVELICSDQSEHRRRIETRQSDIEGLRLPAWQDVLERDYTEWRAPLRVDTAHTSADASAAHILAMLAQRA